MIFHIGLFYVYDLAGIADMVYERPASYLQHQYENAPTDSAKAYWLQKITDRANCGNADAKKLLGKIQGAKRV